MSHPYRSQTQPEVAFVGTHLPRRCGIATFTRDLREAVKASGVRTRMVAIDDSQGKLVYPDEVDFAIDQSEPDDFREAANFLNRQGIDVVCLQHEFGIYGGPAGSFVLDLLNRVDTPIVTTFHTILEQPDDAQSEVMAELIRLSRRLIVMSVRGADILEAKYHAPADRIRIVPHGIPVSDPPKLRTREQKVLLTTGLLGRSKGVELMIRALPEIVSRHPEVEYRVVGATHPHVKLGQGESYRNSLKSLAKRLGVSNHVKLVNRFLSNEELAEELDHADIYVTPYGSRQQITSGTLAHAFGSGNVVVSTPYWHAEELLAGGLGVLTPFGDPSALAASIVDLLDHPERMRSMREAAYQRGLEMQWPSVGAQYAAIFREAVEPGPLALPMPKLGSQAPSLKLDHLMQMTDDVGVIQHAKFGLPNRNFGYCTDDNARALILAVRLRDTDLAKEARELESKCMAFLLHAMNDRSSRMRNFMTFGREWSEAEGSEESHGRAVWALGEATVGAASADVRAVAAELFDRALPIMSRFTSPRSWAHAILGIIARDRGSDHEHLAEFGRRLRRGFDLSSSSEWPWFESYLSYDNARLSMAAIEAGRALGDSELQTIGLVSLAWLCDIQTGADGTLQPVGSSRVAMKGEPIPRFDQQPIEAGSMVEATRAAFALTRDARWRFEMERAYGWFCGGNTARLPVYVAETGGCRDGVHASGLNQNQGAESTLAFLTSTFIVESMVANPGKAAFLV